MTQLLTLLLTFATTVHAVFGCCWHHAPTQVGGSKQNRCVVALGCSCHSHEHVAANQASDDVNAQSGVSAVGERAPIGMPLNQRPLRDHDCHGSKCVGLLTEKPQDIGKTSAFCPFGPAPAIALEQIASIDLRDGPWGHLLVFEPMRPIRAHLFLRVLLI